MPQTWIHIIMLKVAPTMDAVIKISPPSCLLEIMKLTFLTISFISFFVPILQIKRKLVYLFDSVNYLFFFLKLFVTRINCYFLLGPFANGGAAPTLIPYIYDPVIKHWPRPDHLEMVRNNIISEICPVYI